MMLKLKLYLFGVIHRCATMFSVKFRTENFIYRFVQKFIRPLLVPRGKFLIQAGDRKMFVNGSDYIIAAELITYGAFERDVEAVFERVIRPSMTVVDLGANIGYFTLKASSLVGPEGKVFAFEPEPENYKILCENVKLNHGKNVEPVCAVVQAEEGVCLLYRDKKNHGAHSLSKGNLLSEESSSVSCKATSLDRFLSNRGCTHVDFIKMDVQGAEGLVLEGCRNVISQNPGLKILMEFWPSGLRQLKTDPYEMLKKLAEDGFRFSVLLQDGRLSPVEDLQKVVDDAEGKDYTNLFLEKIRS